MIDTEDIRRLERLLVIVTARASRSGNTARGYYYRGNPDHIVGYMARQSGERGCEVIALQRAIDALKDTDE